MAHPTTEDAVSVLRAMLQAFDVDQQAGDTSAIGRARRFIREYDRQLTTVNALVEITQRYEAISESDHEYIEEEVLERVVNSDEPAHFECEGCGANMWISVKVMEGSPYAKR